MRKVGNVVSNQIYNPDNKKPPVPVDADEADSAMERFIRQKYTNNVVAKSSSVLNSGLGEGTPPPLPPKNSSSKFGFRAATSSLFPLSSRSKKEKAAHDSRPTSSPGHSNKPSKVFGAAVGYDGPDETERKLANLRDMGFGDSQRNAMVLKGVNGDLERAVEALVRLGEGDKRSPANASPANVPALRSTRSLTPMTTSPSAGLSLGLSVGQKAGSDRPFTPSSTSTSNNPFDIFPPAQPQTAQSTGSLQTNNPYSQSANPYGPIRQQTDPLSQAFQSLSVTTPQTLFPNHTGGQASQQPQPSTYQQPPVPSLPSSPLSYQGASFPTMGSMAYSQPSQQPVQQQGTSYNPFFTNAASPMQQQLPQQYSQPHLMQHNMALNTVQSPSSYANNPFARSPTRIASPNMLGQIPEQTQSTFQSMSPVQQQPFGNNPFFSNEVAQSPGQMTHQSQYFAPQQQRADKASIMALYGPAVPSQQPASSNYAFGTQAEQPQQGLQNFGQSAPEPPFQPQRSQTAPVAPASHQPMSPIPQMGSKNPFMNAGSTAAQTSPDPFAANRHVTRESVILGNDLAWANGRHSPDAFASLSARHV